MKIGISMSLYDTKFGPIVFRDGSLEDKIREVKEYGYDGVDLFSNVEDMVTAKEVRRKFEEAGLPVAMLIAIRLSEKGVNLTSSDSEHRKFSIGAFMNQIEIAQAMGANRIPIGFLRGQRAESMTEEAYDALLADSLRQIAPFAAEREVEICLEPVNRYEMNTMNSAARALQFLKAYPIDNVSLLMDAFHMNMEDAGIPETIQLCKGHIGHVHLPDNNRYACGSGCFDFANIIGALKQAGFDNYVSVEAFPVPDRNQCAKQSIEVLRRYL